MSSRKSILIFDTSVVNAVHDDTASARLVLEIGKSARVRLTETTLSEVAATKDSSRRSTLLGLCRHMLARGECIKPFNWITEELVKKHARNPNIFDWEAIILRSRAIERELASGEFLGRDDSSLEMRMDARKNNKAFESIHIQSRAKTEALFESGPRPSLEETIRILSADGGEIWKTAVGLYTKASGHVLTEAAIRDFSRACPPFHALLIAICVAQFERCVKDIRAESIYKAGRLDTFMAVYLPYCDQFVTNDPGQRAALSAVADRVSQLTRVSSYAEFRTEVLA